MTTDGIDRILTARAPTPAGHYSQATTWRDLVFISGQLPIGGEAIAPSGPSFADQAGQALSNLFAIAEAAGSAPDRILRVTAYIVGIENWAEFDLVYAARFGKAKPARTVVPVSELHHGYLVEIDAIAAPRPLATERTRFVQREHR